MIRSLGQSCLLKQSKLALSINDIKLNRAEVGDLMQFSLVSQHGVYTNVDLLNFGKIVDYLGRPIGDETGKAEGAKVNIFAPAENQERKKIDSQLFTGNIAVDFTKPLAKGNFVVFQGDANKGIEHCF